MTGDVEVCIHTPGKIHIGPFFRGSVGVIALPNTYDT